MDENEFDLRDVLLGRKYPEGKVRVWFDEEPWYELEALEKKHANLKSEDPEFQKVERRITQVQKQIEAEAYTVHLRGISPRAGEDIISEALSTLPFKRDAYGRDDVLQTIERNRLIKEISFAEHVKKVVTPDGRTQVWNESDKRDLARAFLGEAPDSATAAVDQAIAAVSKKFVEQQTEYANVDF